jgi:hypothetical protein
MYYLFFISKQYREYRMEVSAWSLGKFFLGMDDAWRKFCDINGFALPDVDGVIWPIGTSCLTVPPEGISCRRYGKVPDYLSQQMMTQLFNPLDYPGICNPLSGPGECLPP